MDSGNAQASSLRLRVSQRKLNLVAAMIRGLSVREAVKQLTFCKRRIASDVKKCVLSAAANAENKRQTSSSELLVTSATTGRAKCLRRIRPRAKGRGAGVKKYFANLYITVSKSAT